RFGTLELLAYGGEAPVHVRAVVRVADRRVELREVVALLADGRGGGFEPAANGLGVHARPILHDPQVPQRSAAVCTGASQSSVSSSSSVRRVIDAPAIS